MRIRTRISHVTFKTSLVLLILAVGMLGETLRLPHASTTVRSEHLGSGFVQLSIAGEKERVRTQHAEQVVTASFDDADDTLLKQSEREFWAVQRMVSAGEPLAPPAITERSATFNRARAPPLNMI